MIRPQPKHMLTERQRLATQFAFVHFALSTKFGHDSWADFRVQFARKEYLAQVARDERQGKVA